MKAEVRFWIRDPMNGVNNARSDVNRKIFKLFREAGIAIPSPHEIRVLDPAAIAVRRPRCRAADDEDDADPRADDPGRRLRAELRPAAAAPAARNVNKVATACQLRFRPRRHHGCWRAARSRLRALAPAIASSTMARC